MASEKNNNPTRIKLDSPMAFARALARQELWEEGVSISNKPDYDEVINKEGFTRRIVNNVQLAETSITEKVAMLTTVDKWEEEEEE